MQYRLLIRTLGLLLCGEGVLMLPSLFVSLIYGGGDALSFIITIAILIAVGVPLAVFNKTKGHMHAREGFAIVGLGWLLMGFFGGLPFFISGTIPSLVDSFFESVSGFTTTGASILTAIEGLPKGILFWRSFTHWVGGMGVLVLTLAMLPRFGGERNIAILEAESPGPTTSKLVPKIRETAKYLYLIYLSLTVIEVILLIIAGLPVYDAFIHAFGTAGTGGFSNMNLSVGAYGNVYVEIIITVFMLLFGINFSLYFIFLSGKLFKAFKNQEFYLYGILVLGAMAVITANILPLYTSVFEAFRYSGFQVASILTTTGFATADFNTWPMLSKSILVALMVVGASAGSTGGGVKVIRLLIAGKGIRRELHRIMHPRSVRQIRMNGKPLEDGILRTTLVFLFGYFMIAVAAVIIVSFDNFDFETTFTSVIATISNIGPGLGLVGPIGNYSGFSDLSKITMVFCMLAGRLEVMPMLLLLMPSAWKRK